MAITATVKTNFGTSVNLYIEWFSSSGDKVSGYRFDYHGYADKTTYQAATLGNDSACQWSQLVTFTDNGTTPILQQAQSALLTALAAQGITDATVTS